MYIKSVGKNRVRHCAVQPMTWHICVRSVWPVIWYLGILSLLQHSPGLMDPHRVVGQCSVSGKWLLGVALWTYQQGCWLTQHNEFLSPPPPCIHKCSDSICWCVSPLCYFLYFAWVEWPLNCHCIILWVLVVDNPLHPLPLLEPWLGPTISFFVSVFLIWTLLLYARTNLAYLLLCP